MTRLDMMIFAAVETENRRAAGGRLVNNITGERQVLHALPDFSRFDEGE